MTVPVAFPTAENALRSWLLSVLPSYGLNIPVYTRTPNPRPARFVVVRRTGGPRRNVVVDDAQLTVEVWDNTTGGPGADAPIDVATGVVRALVGSVRNVRTPSGHLIYSVVEFGGPAFLPDESGHPRMSWTVQAHVRGVALTAS